MSPLRAHPVPHYDLPAYPLRLALAANPQLLEGRLPHAWRKHAELAGAAGLFLAANLAGCGDGRDNRAPATNAPPSMIVAPLFLHGDGRGVTGCVVVSAPVFLSEEEALQVIQDELSRNGVHFSQYDVLLDDIVIPERTESLVRHPDGQLEIRIQETGNTTPLTIDLYDEQCHLAVEFVSYTDYCVLGGPSTLEIFNFPEVGRFLGEQLSHSPRPLRVGIFYDPLTRDDAMYQWVAKRMPEATDLDTLLQQLQEAQTTPDPAAEESRRLLRLQVRDFVDWLRAQGVI